MDNIIEVRDLIRTYNLYPNKTEQIKSILFNNKKYKKFYALNGINFEVKSGESLGLIGINGSGKSTLSNIIGGLSPQTSGEVITRGRVSLLSISAGLNGQLTGRENIELKCLMLGFSKKVIRELEPEIIEFSELGDFIDQPVKNYSSGMRSRLGFSISISLDPDIFIIDEALSVGDSAFANKCLAKMEDFKRQGKAMIFVSHSVTQMKKFCDRILWLESGRVKAIGTSKYVLNYYEGFLRYWTKLSSEEKQEYKTIALKTPVYKKIDDKNLTLYDHGASEYSWINNFISESKKKKGKSTTPIESYTSMLCHIKEPNSKVYENPLDRDKFELAKTHMRKVYYVKKKMKLNNEEYLLLSENESFQKELLGWINKPNVKALPYTNVSSDKFTVKLNGNGKGYAAPWGGGKQVVFKSLTEFENENFYVERTILIRNNIWYYGKINDKYIWIYSQNTF